MKFKHNQKYIIEAEISIYCIVIVKLQMMKKQKSLYQAGHKNIISTFNKNKRFNDSEKTENKINMKTHR